MAKSGTVSNVGVKGGSRSVETRRLLVDAAIRTLAKEGYAGASARTIAQEAGATQGLIFYHFGSVANLLLAALDSVSADRIEQYNAMVSEAHSASELFDAATAIFRTDLDAGYISVLVEMIAGASSTPGLGAEVAARIEPWRDFAQNVFERSLRHSAMSDVLPASDIAHAIVALYLGLEMLSHLDGNREPALKLFALAQQFSALLQPATSVSTTEDPS